MGITSYMEITIRMVHPDDRDAHASLSSELSNNQYVKDNARISFEPSKKGALGLTLDDIKLIVETGVQLIELARAIVAWYQKTRSTASIAVESNGKTTTITPDDINNENIVHRAVVGAPDPRKSSCVLIGVDDYSPLDPLPAVERNIEQLEEALTDPGIWGIPPERLHKVDYPQTAEAIRRAISSAISEATDTLLVYYAGHGLYKKDQGLLLALPDAARDGAHGTLPWNSLAETISQATADRRVVLLDCCYAGLALPNEQDLPDLLSTAKISNTYMMTAADGEAWSPPGQECTSFTGELIRVLREGIPSDPQPHEFLNLNEIHREVDSVLKSEKRPRPQRHDPVGDGRRAHFRNVAPESQPESPSDQPAPRDRQRPAPPGSSRPWRRLLNWRYAAVLGVIVVVAALVTAFWPSSQKNHLLGPINLVNYCSQQNLTIRDGYCVEPVDLTRACDQYYSTNDLHGRYTSSDADSGTCFTPAGKQVGGVNNLPDYCKKNFPGTTATPDNPTYKNAWVCQVSVNDDVVCVTEYRVPGAQAREISPGDWNCYN